jgi:hypothetical protein
MYLLCCDAARVVNPVTCALDRGERKTNPAKASREESPPRRNQPSWIDRVVVAGRRGASIGLVWRPREPTKIVAINPGDRPLQTRRLSIRWHICTSAAGHTIDHAPAGRRRRSTGRGRAGQWHTYCHRRHARRRRVCSQWFTCTLAARGGNRFELALQATRRSTPRWNVHGFLPDPERLNPTLYGASSSDLRDPHGYG